MGSPNEHTLSSFNLAQTAVACVGESQRSARLTGVVGACGGGVSAVSGMDSTSVRLECPVPVLSGPAELGTLGPP